MHAQIEHFQDSERAKGRSEDSERGALLGLTDHVKSGSAVLVSLEEPRRESCCLLLRS